MFDATNGSVVGVALKSEGEHAITVIVPSSVVQNFLESIKRGITPARLVCPGFKFQDGENEAMRQKLGLDEIKESQLPNGVTTMGILITKVDGLNKARYEKERGKSNDDIGLKKGDYLLALEGCDVGSDGSVLFR